MKTVLITGAAGKIGGALLQFLRGKYRLRLSDLKPVPNQARDEEFATADLADLESLTRVAAGADAVIHLGGVSKEDAWDQVLPANIVGVYNLFEAARRVGVKRVVFASSNHAVGFYRRDQKITADASVRPDGRYGLSKAFGEALGSLYADKYGLEVFCIRIGAMTDRPLHLRQLAIWVSPRDLAQLIEIGIELPNLRFEIVFGMSDNKRAWWDNSNAHRLGYRPQDRSEDFAEEAIKSEPTHSPYDPAVIFQGGPYVTAEFIADPSKPRGH